MKDLGNASFVLSIQIYKDRPRGILGLSQKSYIDKVLSRFDMGLEDDPISISQVKQSSNFEKWIEAMKEDEINERQWCLGPRKVA